MLVDIDLDFFSTRNPFRSLYPGANLYERLRSLYVFEPYPKGAEGEAKVNYALESCRKRTKLLDELQNIFEYLDANGTLDGYNGPGKIHLESVRDIVDAVESSEEGSEGGVDWMLVHNAGCTCDDTELPHHVSDMQEVSCTTVVVHTVYHIKIHILLKIGRNDVQPVIQIAHVLTRQVNKNNVQYVYFFA